MNIERVSIKQIFKAKEFDSVAREYAEESGHGLSGVVDKPAYIRIEDYGCMKCAGAYEECRLVGFVVVILIPSLHNSCNIAVVDSLFLSAEHRKGVAGLRLIREAERMAIEMNAAGLELSAPNGSRLDSLYSKLFTRTNNAYFKNLRG